MARFANNINKLKFHTEYSKTNILKEIVRFAESAGYTIADLDEDRPWGGFVRFDYKDGDNFVDEFFPGVDPVEARLGNPDAELSPKILLIEPSQRLSWQMHHRRAERWVFLTAGGYFKSSNPEEMGEQITAQKGEVVQFKEGECHRLVGSESGVTLVAEIWQHTDTNNPSDENDIVRLQDDYKR